ncbi:hypothetical protein E4U55_005210 [Claviceps digitariae]|nr:hypothetical protein E4U55_005210 [Claviceps digitariae]
MLSIAELLNPLEPGTNNAEQPRQSPRRERFGLSFYSSIIKHSDERPTIKRRGLSPPAVRGAINFAPFEDVSDGVVREIMKYRIPQFGRIHRSFEHIPYNSSKRDFSAKTGREYIEAFRYTFQIPGQASVYTVMWDYTIGLVRVTPFFKSMGYTKTKPSQALDKNPGLRDVCPSLTGGAVLAQGYWMPYHCAKALCATFCHEISGALIPIFGPEFPSQCTSPASPRFGDMIISQQLIAEAIARAPRHDMRRPDTEFGGSDAAVFNFFDREPAMPRPASLPTMAPLRTESHLARRRSYYDVKVTRERLRHTIDAIDADYKNSRYSAIGPSKDFLTRDAADEVHPDCEDSEDGEGPCVDAGHSIFNNNSHSRKRLFNHHRTTGGECKRRKLVDDSPLMTEGLYENEERRTVERRALPQSRGLAVSRRQERMESAQEEDNSELSAASALVQTETEARHETQTESPGAPDQQVIQRD